jgi:hypothetical protein
LLRAEIRGATPIAERLEQVADGGGPGAMRRLTYEPAPYHHQRGNARKSPGPINGQRALDTSVQIIPASPRRIGVDFVEKQVVVFDRTSSGVFHGHVRTWDELLPIQQAVLRDLFGFGKRGSWPKL